MASTLDQVLAPFTLRGFYLLTWGAALGTNLWQSCLSAKSHKTLSPTQYAALAREQAPGYFAASTLLTGGLLLTHLYFHPSLLQAPFQRPHWYQVEEGVQALLISAAFVPQAVNLLCTRARAANVKADEKVTTAQPKSSCAGVLPAVLNGVSLVALVALGLAVSM